MKISKAFNTPSSKKFKNFNSEEYIAKSKLAPWLKRVLGKIGRIVLKQGEQVIKIGNKIVEKFVFFVQKYPKTSATVIFMSLAIWLTPNIPILGPLLKSIIRFVGIMAAVAFYLMEAFAPELKRIREMMVRNLKRSLDWAKKAQPA